MATNGNMMKRLVLDRPEERDLRVLATAKGIDRLAGGHGLTPYETTVALKLALSAVVRANRAPMATIHQFRGFLLDIEAEVAAEGARDEGGCAASRDEAGAGSLDLSTVDARRPDGKEEA